LCWLNLIFLLFVSLLPFSTGMLGHFLRQRVAQYFYFGNQLAIGAALLAQWFYAWRKSLLVEDAVPAVIRSLGIRLTIFPVATAVALVVSIFNTELSFQACFITFLLFMAIERRRSRTKKGT
jgi:uncharacterized membrane protein